MRTWLAILLLTIAACGGPRRAAGDDDTLPDPGGARPGGDPDDGSAPAANELERRQHAACERIIPRLTECAVADARRQLSPEKLAELDLERTAPIHTREHLRKCKAAPMSSRQVRVYEVCDREETECEPLAECLMHAQPKDP
jgi:hypothetical protein